MPVYRMNVNPGGKQPKMRDTVWASEIQKMNYTIGVPKGNRVVLQERGICTDTLGRKDMRTII